MRGWYRMACWNGLSVAQQARLVEYGVLSIDYEPEGDCPNGAEIAIETMHDVAPGPRFYCRSCAVAYLGGRDATFGVDPGTIDGAPGELRCFLHGKVIGPAPARNCEDCRVEIATTTRSAGLL